MLGLNPIRSLQPGRSLYTYELGWLVGVLLSSLPSNTSGQSGKDCRDWPASLALPHPFQLDFCDHHFKPTFLAGHRLEDNPGVRRHLVKKPSRTQGGRGSPGLAPILRRKKKKKKLDRRPHEVPHWQALSLCLPCTLHFLHPCPGALGGRSLAWWLPWLHQGTHPGVRGAE